MFNRQAILIVGSNFYNGLDLAAAVEELDGTVIGPIDSIDAALTLLDDTGIAAAIVSCHIGEDVKPLVRRLTGLGLPFVLQNAGAIPANISVEHPDVPVLSLPLHAETVLTSLLNEIHKAAIPPGPVAVQAKGN